MKQTNVGVTSHYSLGHERYKVNVGVTSHYSLGHERYNHSRQAVMVNMGVTSH